MENFYKKIYKADDKTLEAWYYLKSQTQTEITILNVQEKEIPGRVWASGDIDYRLSIKEIILPVKHVSILLHDQDNLGYYYLKIPYWLFKKNDDLEIHRIPGNKRFTMNHDDKLYEKFGDNDYLKAMEGSGTDMLRIKTMHKIHSEPKTPKLTPSYTEKQKSVIFKPNARYL